MNMTNRYMSQEKSMKQFNKQIVTLDEAEKSFEIAMMGSGDQTVVLISGAGGPLEGWMKLWPLFDGSFTVFAYNRLGIGASSEPMEPQNAINMATDLKQLLVSAGLKPPYILVGHSLGGFVCQAFASLNPNDVTSVLFLESSTIEDVESSKHKKIKGNPQSEVNCVLESVEQLKKIMSFPQVPITVIAGFHPLSRMLLPKNRFLTRLENQRKLIDLSPDNEFVVATKSGHFPQISEPRLVVDSIYKHVKRPNVTN